MRSGIPGSALLITGGSTGIGLALASSLGRAGASVTLLARGRERLARAKTELRTRGIEASVIVADVADLPALRTALASASTPFDFVVNCAAVQGPIGPFASADMAAWTRTITVNLIGTANVIHVVLPGMLERGGGAIVNFSGGGATSPRPQFSAYAAAKTAVLRFTECLALELHASGVRVNAVAPGAINTGMLDETIAAGSRAGAELAVALKRKQQGGDPVAAVCELVAFLLSEDAQWINGRLISAQHDPWRDWAERRHQTLPPDAGTLRRVPMPPQS